MFALHKPQTAMRDTLAFGPSACPPHLFGGDVAEVVRGLKVHANTISYARLTSLEASFPRARDWIGHAPFNDLSRRYIEGGGGVAEPLALIGRDFPAWLAVQGQPATLIAVARYEWLWLQVYHAAEADAMSVAAFAGKDDIAIMSTHVARHPASAYVLNEASLDEALGLGNIIDAAAVMISRPDADMIITPISLLQAQLLGVLENLPHSSLRAKRGNPYSIEASGLPRRCAPRKDEAHCELDVLAAPISIGAMLEAASHDTNEDDLFSALIGLINAGALIQTGDT